MALRRRSSPSTKRGMTVQEAGHRGGTATSRKYGEGFYKEIGHKGGQRVRKLISQGKSRAEPRRRR